MTRRGSSDAATGFGPHTPGMMKIIGEVHELVDEHRLRNGKHKWNWNIRARLQIFIPGWIAKLTITNGPRKGPHTKQENTEP